MTPPNNNIIGMYRSSDIKDVVKIKVKKYAGYFNPETRSFSVDPQLTSFADLQTILITAFELTGPFHIAYLCRDDVGDKVFLSMLTDWDLDAAFLTSSDPYLRLKLDAEPNKEGLMSKMIHLKTAEEVMDEEQTNKNSKWISQKSWMNSWTGAVNRFSTWSNQSWLKEEDCMFPLQPPLDDAEFRKFLDGDGRLVKPEELRLRIYQGGITPALRKVVWRILLNIFPPHMTGNERIQYMKKKSGEYDRLRWKWQDKADDEHVKCVSNMVWKDVLRTDRTHPYYEGEDSNPHSVSLLNILSTYALAHPSVGYCQGMSDIASPIMMVMDNEAQAYVCFCGIMQRLKRNFSSDGKALSTKFQHLGALLKYFDREFFHYLTSVEGDHMFFCHRWILLEMKREFKFDDVVLVLEVMWSSLPPFPPEDDLPLEEDPSKIKECPDEKKETIQQDEKKDGKTPVARIRSNTAAMCRSFSDIQTKSLAGNKAAGMRRPLIGDLRRRHTETQRDETFDSLSSDFESLLKEIKADSFGSSQDEEDTTGVRWYTHDVAGGVDYSLPSHLPPEQNPAAAALEVTQKTDDDDEEDSSLVTCELPSPDRLGHGNPFLLFLCLAVLREDRDVIHERKDYDEFAMTMHRKVRSHSPRKILSKAMKYFAEYLRTQRDRSVS